MICKNCGKTFTENKSFRKKIFHNTACATEWHNKHKKNYYEIENMESEYEMPRYVCPERHITILDFDPKEDYGKFLAFKCPTCYSK